MTEKEWQERYEITSTKGRIWRAKRDTHDGGRRFDAKGRL